MEWNAFLPISTHLFVQIFPELFHFQKLEFLACFENKLSHGFFAFQLGKNLIKICYFLNLSTEYKHVGRFPRSSALRVFPQLWSPRIYGNQHTRTLQSAWRWWWWWWSWCWCPLEMLWWCWWLNGMFYWPDNREGRVENMSPAEARNQKHPNPFIIILVDVVVVVVVLECLKCVSFHSGPLYIRLEHRMRMRWWWWWRRRRG